MKKRIFTDLLLIILLTTIFSVIIFSIKSIFFNDAKTTYIEEEYIDRSFNAGDNKEDLVKGKEFEKDEIDDFLEEQKKVRFIYIPENFYRESVVETYNLRKVVLSGVFKKDINNLVIEFFKKKYDVRGKMKRGKIKLFGVLKMGAGELVSVFVHELAHFLDIYVYDSSNLEKKDISQIFYDISWKETKVIKGGLGTGDFVSGYSMTNKYEDFAETFNYYVLHNLDFYIKSRKNKNLRKKYDFFRKYVFTGDEFYGYDFGNNEKILNYYRDCTKIPIKLENFLQYLEIRI